MPASALANSAIETALNKLLSLDPDSKHRLKPLSGQRLYLFVDPLPTGFCLAFSSQVDLLTITSPADEIRKELDDKACCIQTDIATLPSLTKTSELTRLIQQKKLHLDGSLSVAQQVSALFQSLDIDAEELLAAYTGDVMANQLFRVAGALKDKMVSGHQQFQAVVANALVEEKHVAAHRLAVMHFSDEVGQLRDDVARAEARIKQLEVKLGQSC